MRKISSQREVFEAYADVADDTATVGDYVRVNVAEHSKTTCFGPTDHIPVTGWHVVEIDWTDKTLLLAPIEERTLDD